MKVTCRRCGDVHRCVLPADEVLVARRAKAAAERRAEAAEEQARDWRQAAHELGSHRSQVVSGVRLDAQREREQGIRFLVFGAPIVHRVLVAALRSI